MRISFLFLVLFVAFHTAFPQRTSPKGKLFIMGGGSRSDEMVERIISEAGLRNGGYGIILPMSSEDPDSAVYYANQQFIKKDIKSVYGLNFVKGETLAPAKLDSIRNAKLIYISGGDQSRFMGIVLGTEIEKAIKQAYADGCLVGGTSAGAAVMSKSMITGNELKHPEYNSTFRTIESENIEIKPGLGLLENSIIDQHFVWRSRHNRLISAVIEFPGMKGIGIDESTAILVSGSTAEVIGESQVIILENPKKSKVIRNGQLGATGLQMSVLLPGDKFKL